MHPTELGRHERQLDALAHDLSALGLYAEVDIQSGRRGRWVVTPGKGVLRIPSHRPWRQTGMHMVRVGLEVIHLTTDDLQSVVLVAADLAVNGRSTIGSASAGEYCLAETRPLLSRHPAKPTLWWFTASGELAELGLLEPPNTRLAKPHAERPA